MLIISNVFMTFAWYGHLKMREFKCSLGELVDLDDPNTYVYLTDNCDLLDDLMFKEIGQTLVYMNYFHVEYFPKKMAQNILPLKKK